MDRVPANELYYMKDKIRFREIYEGILSSAKMGYRRKEIWWTNGDNIEYQKSRIVWYFPDVSIEDQSDHIIVSWDIQNNSPP